MLRTLGGRILLASLLPLVMAVAALGLFLGTRFEAYHLDRMHADLSHQAWLIVRLLAPDLAAEQWEAVGTLVADMARANPEASIVVADARGTIVAASSSRGPSVAGTAPVREKLGLALAGQTARHLGNTFDDEGMFVALPVSYEGRTVGALHLSFDVEHVEALTRELRLTVLGAVLAAGTLAAMVALRLARSLARPVEALARGAARLADGHLEERVSFPGGPPTAELDALASAFNHLAARLQELEATRRAFLADVSHDLRAPVGAIQVATETLLAGAEEEPELRRRLITGIGGEVRRLARLTGDLLELARFEAGRLELHRQPTDLGQLVEGLVATYQTEAAERGITMTVEAPSDLPTLDLDPDRIAQVLANLLTNALKFTPQGGRVAVRVAVESTHAALSVSDTGTGIPPEALPRLFDRFYQGNYGQGRKPGLGLGLAIVRALVEAHGGRVAVESRPGIGSTFTVLLPRDGAPQQLPSEAPPGPTQMGPRR